MVAEIGDEAQRTSVELAQAQTPIVIEMQLECQVVHQPQTARTQPVRLLARSMYGVIPSGRDPVLTSRPGRTSNLEVVGQAPLHNFHQLIARDTTYRVIPMHDVLVELLSEPEPSIRSRGSLLVLVLDHIAQIQAPETINLPGACGLPGYFLLVGGAIATVSAMVSDLASGLLTSSPWWCVCF
jgi:hypothetical protein